MVVTGAEASRKHAAYHVAGHVVADLVYGYRFRFVTIRPLESGGEDGSLCGSVRGRARDLAVVQLAGIAAAARMAGQDPREETVWSGDERDDSAAADTFIDNWIAFLTRIYGEAPYRDRIRDEILDRTQKLVDTNWGAIEVIAECLLARETLSYNDTERILKERCPEFRHGEKV
ncbi:MULTISPECIES: hypothetical protein [unclassified Methanoregula]|uniref:hypothetical protein n=1 Tax=unclassified Methanoregula TaxID=2649730 RepID=UPI0009C6F1A7|nr:MULTISPECIES: hypothetical protein [unclassified Methanoregula]OPX65298.1 MAG: hypothetical protein A4E33_00331 [Methanoregula sp. PtaB.Bin085]OPY32207.1 MAG: hypothetical protein A4E34_02581 [Methanoregula sp. PtaU1.Bin006]